MLQDDLKEVNQDVKSLQKDRRRYFRTLFGAIVVFGFFLASLTLLGFGMVAIGFGWLP